MSFDLPAMNKVKEDKAALAADLKRIVSDSDELLREIAGSTAAEFANTRGKVKAQLGAARARIDEARMHAAEKVYHAADETQLYIRENPWKVIGLAALIGVVAALLLHRDEER